ncbi:MAG: ferrochelatase [Planctomycetota bacterium]
MCPGLASCRWRHGLRTLAAGLPDLRLRIFERSRSRPTAVRETCARVLRGSARLELRPKESDMSECESPAVCTGCSGEQSPCVCHIATKRAALLLNLGTPDTPSNADVRRYLREFLADPFVIKLPRGLGWMTPALSTLIATFRGAKSAEAYREIWWDEGSPLKVITERQSQGLRHKLGGDWSVYYAMRYANPSIRNVIKQMSDDGITDVVVVPMYPQYAGPTTATALEVLYRELRTQGLRFSLAVRNDWYDDRRYIDAQAELLHRFIAERQLRHDNSFLLFSTHSMPASYIKDGDPYEGQVRRSMELVLKRLGWPADRTSLSFQSKLGPVPWLAPATEDVLAELAERGETDVVVCPISFTADCLETLEEIGMGYAEEFSEASAGGTLHLVPSLNDDSQFIDALAAIVRRGPRRMDHFASVEPLSRSSPHEPIESLVDRLVMVGVAVPGPLDQRGAGDGVVTEATLRSMHREREDAIEKARSINKLTGVDGCVVFNTCQRAEVYVLAEHDADLGRLSNVLRETCTCADDAGSPALLVGRDAYRRLLECGLGLSSRLPAETDALEQACSSARMAMQAGTLSPALRRVFDYATERAAEIRRSTGWSDYSTSFGEAALGRLDVPVGGDVVIVGGSTTSKKVLRTLADAGSSHLTFIYRGGARKDIVRHVRGVAPHAKRLCVHRYDDDQVLEAIAHADTVIFGLDRRTPVLDRASLKKLRDFSARPLTIVDFNTFGSTSGVADVEGVSLIASAEVRAAAAEHGADTQAAEGFAETLLKVRQSVSAEFEPESCCSGIGADRGLEPRPLFEDGVTQQVSSACNGCDSCPVGRVAL